MKPILSLLCYLSFGTKDELRSRRFADRHGLFRNKALVRRRLIILSSPTPTNFSEFQ